MPSHSYATMTDRTHEHVLFAMMRGLYTEDKAASPVDPARFPTTVTRLLESPYAGRIILCLDQSADGTQRPIAYAIIIPFWSNEYGGTLAFVDELFVHPESRGRGIARGFFSLIAKDRPFDAVAVVLEVSAKNERARRLYESLGLRERSNTLLAARIADLDIP